MALLVAFSSGSPVRLQLVCRLLGEGPSPRMWVSLHGRLMVVSP